jgi:hypothetical protein
MITIGDGRRIAALVLMLLGVTYIDMVPMAPVPPLDP